MTPRPSQGADEIIQRPFGAAGRFLRTVAGLRLQQITNRYTRRLARLDFESRGPVVLRSLLRPLVPFVQRAPSMLAPSQFRFLNATRELDVDSPWDDPEWPRLWTYNLHYFDDLNASDADSRVTWHRDLIGRWLAANPPTAGTAWEPYPASLRTVNLAKWLLRTGIRDPAALAALDRSARAVRQQLEHHLLGNHLWANGKALFIAGLCVEGDEAAEWRKYGRRILETQVREQILADGAHFELSPMYQGILVEDALDVVNFARGFGQDLPAGVEQRLPSMLGWLEAMTHPDGDIAYFNDSAPAIAPRAADLRDYANALQIEPAAPRRMHAPDGCVLVDMAASGYARLESSSPSHREVIALCDASAVGPDYLPGHAHADTLSFELSIGNRRVIVNAGTSVYAEGEQRSWERSTRAHSTVELAGVNSSEVWSSFRCGARARIISRHATAFPQSVQLQAAHDGYRFLSGRWIHERTWRLTPRSLHVRDCIGATKPARGHFVRGCIRFLLHPEVRPEKLEAKGQWRLTAHDRPLALFLGASSAAWSIESATFAHEFGVCSPTLALCGALEVNDRATADCEFRFGEI